MIMQSQPNKTTTKKAKLFYMDTESFVVDVKTGDIYKDIAEYAERWFNTSNYELDRPLLKGKNTKVIGLRKDDLHENMIKEFAALRTRTDK